MNKTQKLAAVVGTACALFWPIPVGATAGDSHGHGSGHDDHAPAAKPKAAAKSEKSGHGDSHGDTHADNGHSAHDGKPAGGSTSKPAGKPTPVSAATGKLSEPKHADSTSTSKHVVIATAPTGEPAPDQINADVALRLITEGNARWVSGKTTSPNVDSSRRMLLADKGQKPFVTVLTCADSRVPIERVLDRGVGDVFTVRVAGNIAGTSETGTIEYGVGHLKTPLLVVMGHTKCGAVAAAASNAEVHGKIVDLVSAIKPAVDRAKRNNPSASEAELTPIAVRENVWQTVFDLIKGSSEIRSMMSAGELKVVGAVYDISTGKVDFMGEHPWQTELVDAMNARAASHTTTADAEHGQKHE